MRYKVTDLNGRDSAFLPEGFGAEISWFGSEADADKAASALLQIDGGVEWDDEARAVEWRKGKRKGGVIATAAHVTVERYQRVYDNSAITYGLYVWGYKTAKERIYGYCRVSDAIYGRAVADRRDARARRAIDAWRALAEPRCDLDAVLGVA